MRIWVNAGHHINDSGHVEVIEDGKVVISENLETMKVRDELKTVLTNYEVYFVPDDLNLSQSIQWVNKQCSPEDFAIDIHLNAHTNHEVYGTECFYFKQMNEAKVFSRNVSNALETKDRGSIGDIFSNLGYLGWVRDLKCKSVLIELCYITNPNDRSKFTSQKAAIGIKNSIDELFQVQSVKVAELKQSLYQLTVALLRAQIASLQERISKLLNK